MVFGCLIGVVVLFVYVGNVGCFNIVFEDDVGDWVVEVFNYLFVFM